MLGKELKLLITINEVKAYDVARVMGVSQSTVTRLCQPSHELTNSELEDVLTAMECLKGEQIIKSVDLTDTIERSIQIC